MLTAAIICGVLGAPLVAARLLPPPEIGRIGIFERVVQTVPGSNAQAGHFAPTGWVWGEALGSGTYFSSDRSAIAHITMHANVDDPDELLREGLPLGARLAPSIAIQVRKGLTGSIIEYDLAAGDDPAITTTVCTLSPPRTCLLVRATFSSGAEAQRDQALHDIKHLIREIEIVS